MTDLDLATADGQDRYVPSATRDITSAGHEGVYEWIGENLVTAGMRALDFGCGTGYGAALLAQAGATVDGVDNVWALTDDPSVDMDRAVGPAAVCHRPRRDRSPRRSQTRARRPVSGA
jgi:protein-L-isoaspartate O-methyltransferase